MALPENDLFQKEPDARLSTFLLIFRLHVKSLFGQEISPHQFLKDFKALKEKRGWTDQDITLEGFLEEVQNLQSRATSNFDDDKKSSVYNVISLADQIETLVQAAIDLDKENP